MEEVECVASSRSFICGGSEAIINACLPELCGGGKWRRGRRSGIMSGRRNAAFTPLDLEGSGDGVSHRRGGGRNPETWTQVWLISTRCNLSLIDYNYISITPSIDLTGCFISRSNRPAETAPWLQI